ncbi:MAG: hypothetical protein AB1546_09630, partial [bacterium]
TPFYDADEGECIIRRDSGAPTFSVSYFSDAALTVPLPQDTATGRSMAKPGLIYLKMTASEELADEPTFSVNQQGTTDVSDQPTTSIDGSLVEYLGSYTVNTANGSTYIDGDASVIPIGTDNDGNTTAAATLPTSGAYFTIDTAAPTFKGSYYTDSKLTETAKLDQNLVPNAKAGSLYIKIVANERLSSAPLISVAQPGSSDITDATTTALDTSKLRYSYTYSVNTANGSGYIDGGASVKLSGSDIAGNAAISAAPTQGASFVIDTTAPSAPTLNVPSTTTFTQIKADGTAEEFITVEVYAKLNLSMTSDDGIDNDGDGRIDEEPNGSDSADNDNDAFTDEDTTANICPDSKYWLYSSETCTNKPVKTKKPNGTAQADSSGDYEMLVSGIQVGENLLYARGIDIAGNIGEFSSPVSVTNTAPQNIALSHEFPEGWNLVGVPLQPTQTTPTTGLGLSNYDLFRYQDGEYAYGYNLDAAAPGMCYWAYFDDATTASSNGIKSTTTSVALTEGWNMVSVPYDKTVEWDSGVKVTSGGDTYSLGTDEADAIVESKIYKYHPDEGAYMEHALGSGEQLEPWEGFVIRALQDCELIFPE